MRNLLRANPCDEQLLMKLSLAYEGADDAANAHGVLEYAVGRCELTSAVDERLLLFHTGRAEWASAVDDATRLIAREPTVEHLRMRAHLRYAAGEPGLAALDFRRILKRAPNDLDAQEGMARYAELMNDLDYVLTLTDPALLSHP
jgi:hypothetical protein